MTKRIIISTCRWPIKQVAEDVVEILVPVSENGAGVLSSDFIHEMNLSAREVEDIEIMTLEKIAWM